MSDVSLEGRADINRVVEDVQFPDLAVRRERGHVHDVERSRAYLASFDDHANLIDAPEPFYIGYQAGWNARRWRYALPWWAWPS